MYNYRLLAKLLETRSCNKNNSSAKHLRRRRLLRQYALLEYVLIGVHIRSHTCPFCTGSVAYFLNLLHWIRTVFSPKIMDKNQETNGAIAEIIGKNHIKYRNHQLRTLADQGRRILWRIQVALLISLFSHVQNSSSKSLQLDYICLPTRWPSPSC